MSYDVSDIEISEGLDAITLAEEVMRNSVCPNICSACGAITYAEPDVQALSSDNPTNCNECGAKKTVNSLFTLIRTI